MSKFFQFCGAQVILFFLLLFTACKGGRHDIDTENIDVKLDIRRFEADLFENKLSKYEEFRKKYPYFLSDYTMGILGFQGDEKAAFDQLMLYKTDPNAGKMYNLVKEKYSDFSSIEKGLTEAYRRFRYYKPDLEIPTIITYTGNFSFYLNPVGMDYIGMALDMHMGSDFKPYDYAGIEQYWRKILTPETIVAHHMMAHGNDLYSSSNSGASFVDDMVYYGKLLYLLDALLPETPDHIKIGMTAKEYEWCVKEEHNIWAFIVKEKYLYETDEKKYLRLLNEGPKTIAPGVPPDAPAMIGRFSGWMAVRKYMEENSGVSINELMHDKDAAKILRLSAYKP